MGPLFLAKEAPLGDLRFAPRICATLRGAFPFNSFDMAQDKFAQDKFCGNDKH